MEKKILETRKTTTTKQATLGFLLCSTTSAKEGKVGAVEKRGESMPRHVTTETRLSGKTQEREREGTKFQVTIEKNKRNSRKRGGGEGEDDNGDDYDQTRNKKKGGEPLARMPCANEPVTMPITSLCWLNSLLLFDISR